MRVHLPVRRQDAYLLHENGTLDVEQQLQQQTMVYLVSPPRPSPSVYGEVSCYVRVRWCTIILYYCVADSPELPNHFSPRNKPIEPVIFVWTLLASVKYVKWHFFGHRYSIRNSCNKSPNSNALKTVEKCSKKYPVKKWILPQLFR